MRRIDHSHPTLKLLDPDPSRGRMSPELLEQQLTIGIA
jgi:hypothetical protein